MKSYPIKADLDLYVDPYAAIPTEIIKQIKFSKHSFDDLWKKSPKSFLYHVFNNFHPFNIR